jgi:imidazoleglycerol phosphate synthase glutamine amidotransferase subunit HisH
MSRMILISSLAALLAVSGTQSANAIQATNQSARDRDALACADAGIAPGSGAFTQCVSDLHHSLWAEQNLEDN